MRWFLLVALTTAMTAGRAGEATSLTDERLKQWLEKHPAADADGNGVLTMEEARQFRRPQQDRGTAENLINLGTAYEETGELEQALERRHAAEPQPEERVLELVEPALAPGRVPRPR